MAYNTGGLIGIDLTATPTGSEGNGAPGVQFALGQRVPTTDGGQYMFVQANGAITQYDAVGIDENYQAAALTGAMCGDGWRLGFAQVAFADNDYGWVALEGSNIKCNLAAECAADTQLYTSATAGTLDDASTSQYAINGVVAVTAQGTASALSDIEIIAVTPRGALSAS